MKFYFFSFAILFFGSAASFHVPVVTTARARTVLRSEEEGKTEAPETPGTAEDPVSSTSPEVGEEAVVETTPQLTVVANGWTPNPTLPLYGLPGSLPPTGFFDPLGFSKDGLTLKDAKRYREAEVQHGRVAMLATVGYLVGEAVPGPFGLTGPANDQLGKLPLPVLLLLGASIGFVEYRRAVVGWVEPDFAPESNSLWTLRDNYYPGDIGFDPLGLKPQDATEFANMQTKELQNGRLAMLGVAGMCAQELVNHKTIAATLAG